MKNTKKPSRYKAPQKKHIKFKVNQSCELMNFIMEKFPEKSRTNIKALLSNKQIFVDGERISQFNYILQIGQEVTISSEKPPKEIPLQKLNIIFEDEYLIVIKKESGLLSISTDKEKEITAFSILSNYIKQADERNHLYVLHRLDRDTSGLMMYAKNQEVKRIMQTDWQDSVMDRCYIVVVEGVVKDEAGTIQSWLTENKNFLVYSSNKPNTGQEAITHYRLLKTSKNYSMLEVRLETGRKNQIRVHMQDIGHPVIGDKKYGATHSPINRLGLHAYILAFRHPITNEVMRFETKVPEEFERLFI